MFKDKKILVIGGTGTIGTHLVRRLLSYGPNIIRIYGRDEYKQFILGQELGEIVNIRYLIGDVRDKERLNKAMQDIDIVFNLAAMKHVPACEYNPFEAVKTNVIGTQNVIDCAIANNVERVIYTSSDKAVSPTNTMGATKLLAERLMTSANFSKGDIKTVFASVRFGNILGSRGSVIPLFKKQIKESSYITITEPSMTRFMMSKDQAIDLILNACQISKGGEVFVLKMPVIKLIDLAETVIDLCCNKENLDKNKIEIKKIGARPGEKLYEELMSEDEAIDALELDDMYIIKPFFENDNYPGCKKVKVCNYSSMEQSILEHEEIVKLIYKEV